MTMNQDIAAVLDGSSPGCIIAGDCLSVMKDMEAGSADLVFCSPPYENARTYGIDFKLKGQDWVDWAVERFQACLRVSRGLVAWVVEGKTRQFRYSATPILFMADLHRAGVHIRKPPVFHRVGIPGSGGPDWLRNDYEFIVCATNGGRLPWSNNTAMGHPPKFNPGGAPSHRTKSGRRVHILHTKRVSSEGKDGMKQQGYNPPTIANPGNVIHLQVGGGLLGHPLAHENEAPFPEALAEFFVKSFCPPDGIVLDPFFGSGTTGAVARKTGRKFIGIDVRESQCELAQRRIYDESLGEKAKPEPAQAEPQLFEEPQ